MEKQNIRIRDPFVLTYDQKYYLYGTTDSNPWEGKGTGFNVYVSEDLIEFSGPYPVFKAADKFWGKTNFWAPEVYFYQNRFYMFASFKAPRVCRGTQVLVSDSPCGIFQPLTSTTVTPKDWECLDGTLYIAPDKSPYLVFCHEWTQVEDGEICASKLSTDLSCAVEPATVLFHASQAKWTRRNVQGNNSGYVTDGPFLYETENDRFLMIWSSFGENGYAMGQSFSKDGLFGEWKHCEKPIFDRDGGHGMLFRTKQGQLTLTIHTPNTLGLERPTFLPLTEKSGCIHMCKFV